MEFFVLKDIKLNSLFEDNIIFVGDIHRKWQYLQSGLTNLKILPEAVVLLGDMECHETLDKLCLPVFEAKASLHWIFGNHDYDGGPAMWENLTSSLLNPLSFHGSLHATVNKVAGIRIAGLGGTFRPRVWLPPNKPRIKKRVDLMEDLACLGKTWTFDEINILGHSLSAMAIWPEDYEFLLNQKADVLVTHEAPSSHPKGISAIDYLARAMGVKLIVHGHHHICYHAYAEDGLRSIGVGPNWGVSINGSVCWRGEKERPLFKTTEGWKTASQFST